MRRFEFTEPDTFNWSLHGSTAVARALKYVIQLLAVGTIYFFLVRLGVELASVYPGTTAIWPPAGFALAAVLLGGYQVVPAIFVASYLANADWSGLTPAAAATAAGNAFEAFAASFVVNEWAGGRNAFATPTGVTKFVLIAIGVAAVSASVGASVTLDLTSGRIEQVVWEKLASVWFPWWLGNLTAVLMITPAVVLWATERRRSFDLPPLLETAAIYAAAGAVGVLAFNPLTADMPSVAPLAVLAVVPPVWAALRRGPRDTATALLILLSF